MKDQLQMAINVGVLNTATAFYTESLRSMVPWMTVMIFIIIADLVAGVRRRYLMKEEIRITKGARDTGAKIVTYSAIVAAMVMWGVVTENPAIPKYTIGGIYAFEGFSIIGNLLKPRGYNLNFAAIISLLFKKLFNVDREYSQDLIKRDDTIRIHTKGSDIESKENLNQDQRLPNMGFIDCDNRIDTNNNSPSSNK